MSDTTAAPAPAGTPTPTPLPRTIALAAGLTTLIAVIVLAFSWPAVTAEPRGIAVAVAGPDDVVSAVAPAIAEQSGDVFDITTVSDRDAALDGVESREFAGAIVLGPEPELLTASANGAVNQVVSQLATPLEAALSNQSGADVTLTVTDVAPFSSEDASGGRLSSAFFPMLFGGMIGGIAISTAIVGTTRRLLAVGVYSAVGGLVLALILQTWLGSIQGEFWLNFSAFTLALAAIAAPIVGFVALIGRAGIAVGPVVMMLFANPISGAALPAQFLPGAWGAVGQWFPPGASATLVRELSYFPAADTTFPWLVLAAWTVGGLALAVVGHFRAGVTSASSDAAPREATKVA